MDITHDPCPPVATLAQQLDDYFENYTSTAMATEHFAVAGARMIELVRATDPVSAIDAKTMLASSEPSNPDEQTLGLGLRRVSSAQRCGPSDYVSRVHYPEVSR